MRRQPSLHILLQRSAATSHSEVFLEIKARDDRGKMDQSRLEMENQEMAEGYKD
jgi:hypothetical protein